MDNYHIELSTTDASGKPANKQQEKETEENDPLNSSNSNWSDIPNENDESRVIFGELTGYNRDPVTGNFKYVISSTWPLYAVITPLLLLINIYFYIHYWDKLNNYVRWITMSMYATSLLTSLQVWVSNPGIPSTSNKALQELDDNDKEFCEKCHMWWDNRKFYLHCRFCNCCIEETESHSTFFGKCIGIGNYMVYNVYFTTHWLQLAFMIFVKGSNI